MGANVDFKQFFGYLEELARILIEDVKRKKSNNNIQNEEKVGELKSKNCWFWFI